MGKDAGEPQALVTYLYLVPRGQVQRSEKAGFRPGLTRPGSLRDLVGQVGRACATQIAAQGIAAVCGLDRGELNLLVGSNDAGKLDHSGVGKPKLQTAVDLLRGGAQAAAQLQVGAEKLGGA